MTSWILAALVALAVSVATVWLILVIAYLWIRPDQATLMEAVRLPVDVIKLVRRLLSSGELPSGSKVRLWLLLGYLLMPIDLVPDFIPVVGYADDVIVVSILLRGAVRQVGFGAVEAAWPGSANSLAVLRRLCRT